MAMTPTRGRLSTGTATSSFMASDDDAMEEASVFTVTSPPRSASKSSAASELFQGETTPKSSRRLFTDEEVESGGFKSNMAPALTPFNANPRRRVARPIQRRDSTESEELIGRKRSSEERRDSHESDVSMHTSPHISPNSYVTLDGRFVTSKNPFSSPMVTEDDNHHIQVTSNAPTLPVMFPAATDSGFSMGFSGHSVSTTTPASPHRNHPTHALLHPRQMREKRGPSRDRMYGLGSSGNENGTSFLDSRFSFTGSPIPEHAHSSNHSMETGSASGGSFQKVRRLTENDDVVSASGYQMYNRRRQYLSIDTAANDVSCNSFSDSSTGTWKTEEEESDRISPTDILSFPPPPTPAKNSSNYPRYRAPPTPVAQRRAERLMQRRTPHPGSILARHLPEHDKETPTVKSRFYDDFDIIQELGKGSFGTVYQVLSRLDGVRTL